MATTFDIFVGDGIEDQYQYPFAVLGTFSDILVKTRPPNETNFSQKTVNVHYTLDRSAKTITFLPGFVPVDGELIRIERLTNRSRQIDYVSGTTLSERNLDNDANRLTSVDQEIEAAIIDALRMNDTQTAWNGEGLPSENCAPAIDANGWVTLAQLEARLIGGQVGEVTGASVYTFTGNGTDTLFELVDARGLATEIADVYVENVYQSSAGLVYVIQNQDDPGYPTGGTGDDFLEFDEPPADGAEIEVKVLSATVVASVLPDSIDTQHIRDGAVTLVKMDAGASPDPTRVLVANTLGIIAARQIGLEDLLATLGFTGPALTALLNDVTLDQFINPVAGDVNWGGNKITNHGTPTAGNHVATKLYVDNAVAGIVPQQIQIAHGQISVAEMPHYAGNSTVFRQVDGDDGLNFVPQAIMIQLGPWNVTTPTSAAAHGVGWFHRFGSSRPSPPSPMTIWKDVVPTGILAPIEQPGGSIQASAFQIGVDGSNRFRIYDEGTQNGGFWDWDVSGFITWFAIGY